MAVRNYTTKFNSDTRSFDAGVERMTAELKKLKKELVDNKRQQAETSKEIKNAQKELNKLQQETKKTNTVTAEQQKRMDQLAGTIQNGNKRLEELQQRQQELSVKITGANNKIRDQKEALKGLKPAMSDAASAGKDIAKTLGTITAAATAAGAAIFSCSHDAAQWADNLNTTSKITGIDTATLQQWEYAANLIDVSVDTLSTSLTRLTQNMSQAGRSGNSAAAKAFKDLGVAIEDTGGNLRDKQEVFEEVIAKLADIEDYTTRDAYAMEIFGRSAQELNPLIMGGVETLKQLGQEAQAAGLIMSQETLNNLNDFNDKIDLLKSKGAALAHIAAEQATPAFDGLLEVADELLDEINELAQSGQLHDIAVAVADDIKNAAQALKNIITFLWQYKDAIAGLAAAWAAFKVGMSISNLITALIAGFKALKVVIQGTTTDFAALNAVMNANPIGIVVGLVAALAAGLTVLAVVSDNTSENIKALNQELESTKQVSESRVADAEAEAQMIRDLGEEYNKLRTQQKEGKDVQQQLDVVAGQLAKKLGLSAEEMKNVAGAYKDMNQQIEDTAGYLTAKARAEELEKLLKESYAAQKELERYRYGEGHVFAGEWSNSDAKRSYEELTEEIEGYKSALEEAQKQVFTYEQAIEKATDDTEQAAVQTEDLTDALKELSTTSSNAKSSMKDLAGMYDTLNDGTELSITQLWDLIEKYPEYASQLLNAKGNIDLQKEAVKALFEAKKQEYILTQQATIDKIGLSNQETETVVSNIKTQIEVYKNQLTVLEGMRAQIGDVAVESSKKQATAEIKAMQAELDKILAAIKARANIDLVKNLSIDDLSSGSESTKSTQKDTVTLSGGGVQAAGETYAQAYLQWISRMKSLGKMSLQAEYDHLNRLKAMDNISAEDRYQIEVQLYNARKQLAADGEKAMQTALERENKQAQKAAEAYKKLINDRMELYRQQADAARSAADKEIAALDALIKKRNEESEDAKRQKELEAINARLKYDRLTELDRYELQRKKQDILNEQAEANYQRQIEQRKATIEANAAATEQRYSNMSSRLDALLDRLDYSVARQTGTLTNQQIVNHNSTQQNIQLVQNGLSDTQLINELKRALTDR